MTNDKYLSIDGYKDLDLMFRAHLVLVAEGAKPAATAGNKDKKTALKVLNSLGIDCISPVRRHRGEWALTFYNPSCQSDESSIKELWAGYSDVKEAEREWGRAYGYPKCCIEEYLKPEGDVVFEQQLLHLIKDGAEYPEEFNYLMPSQTPCSINCQASLKVLGKWKDILETYDPEAADLLKRFNKVNWENPVSDTDIDSDGVLTKLRNLWICFKNTVSQ